jgi:LptD protein
LTLRISFFALGIMWLNGTSLAASSQLVGNAESKYLMHSSPDTIHTRDTLNQSKDSLNQGSDSLYQVKDTTSIKAGKKTKKTKIEAPVIYASEDSFAFNLDDKKILLYDKATVNYQNIELKAQFVQFDMTKQVVFASGLPDTSGKVVGLPNFKQGNEVFDARTLNYNFKTKKGYIEAIKSKQDGGYLHAEQTKRMANGDIDLKNGKYTTCDADHPHFYLALTKGISIPNDKIISGPAYMVLEDVPLPIGIPFGFFPSTKSSTSGFIIPTYGEEQLRGLFLRGGGYYFALSDHWDLRLTGDIYSKGTWGMDLTTNYRWIYKFSGSFSAQYYTNISGEPGLPNSQPTSHDFSIVWSHVQDPKANPTHTFSASVNFSTTSYDQNHSYDVASVQNNRKSSSISFTQTWKYVPFNFSASLNHEQNSLDKSFDLTLPSMSFNMGTIYPFRGLNTSGREKWYDNISLSYTSSLRNNIHTYDSLLFTKNMFKEMTNGFQQNIPLGINIKPINGFNISPSFNYSGAAFTEKLVEHYVPKYYRSFDNTTKSNEPVIDTLHGLYYAHALYPSLTLSVNPKIYGMFLVNGERIQAIRHVITPLISFSYIPDLSKILPSYQRTAYDSLQQPVNLHTLSKGEKLLNSPYPMYLGAFPAPQQGSGQSALLNFSLRNTLEMKAKSLRDTSSTYKKISLLEMFDFATSYNIITRTWSNITFNTGTRLLNNKVDIRLTSTIDPYSIDSLGQDSRQLQLLKHEGIGRITNANLNIGLNLTSSQGGKKKENKPEEATVPNSGVQNDMDRQNQLNKPGQDVDFTVPWSANVTYTFTYSKPASKVSLIQSASVRGDLSLTPKWKIGVSSGYDFQAHRVTTTSLNIFRDLHCWEMRLSIVPFGQYQSYSFSINVKSAILHDLKYSKNKSWVDNF